jgi:beta-carotene 3-hydroxylase
VTGFWGLSMTHTLLFLATFAFMELAAWSLHKYVMHGFLWSLHEDHHTPDKTRWWQRNDAFAVFFAVPSFFSILLGTYWINPHWATLGYGIMAYGVVYFFIHEVVIHRRLRFLELNHWYFRAVIQAHREHHQNRFKEEGKNFGMLIVPIRYYVEAFRKA